MPNRLIIVESPSKARTLGRFLGAGHTIKASMGHVRDLPKSRLGVAVDEHFEPEYEVTREAQIKDLRQAVRKAQEVLLASDPDREGEAIAWHLAEALRLKAPGRIVFHEITRQAVEAAMQSPRPIDRDLVAAQEARRVIDRLVGYQLSPLLWKKVRRGTSAGRVQSAAVRLVVDREREIEAFTAEESWTVDALLRTEAGADLTARLVGRAAAPTEPGPAAPPAAPAEEAGGAEDEAERGRDEGRLRIADEASAVELMTALGVDEGGRPGPRTPAFVVGEIVARQQRRNPPAPHTTSSLQQDASTRLRFSPKRTMSLAQQLYEGIDLGDEGPTGLITYMRTDSTRIGEGARAAALDHITAAYGADYVGPGAAGRRAKAAVEAQDAHEAIRPTDPARTPDRITAHLNADQARLYDLIWRRFVASQMAPARFDTTRVDIGAGEFVFRASGSVLRFDGFTRVSRRDEEEDRSLPALRRGEALSLTELKREQHFTQPPPRYTEASLVKELEERGIGRPSTYAQTIDVIQERKYVVEEQRRLHPTALGVTVDGVLREHFPDIVDIAFTADLEKRLDSIEEGQRGFEPVVREWYGPFARTLARAETEMGRVRVPAREIGEPCPQCDEGQLVVREGRFGEFVGCSRYPDCDYVRRETPATETTGEACPQCGRELVVRQGKRGPFVGCSGYPECRYIRPRSGASGAAGGGTRSAAQPAGRDCPDCGKPLLVRQGRRGAFIGCSGYPRCRHTEGEVNPKTAPGADLATLPGGAAPVADGAPGSPATAGAVEPATPEDLGSCPDCGKRLVRRRGRFGAFVGCSGYPGCRHIERRGAAAEPAGTAAG